MAAADHFQYLLLLGGCLLLTAPLEPLFGVRVYRRPRRILRALAGPVVLFALWDVVAIHRGDWTYNPRYVTGWRLPGRLPVEELLFFIVIPLCSIMTFEVVSKVTSRSGRRRG